LVGGGLAATRFGEKPAKMHGRDFGAADRKDIGGRRMGRCQGFGPGVSDRAWIEFIKSRPGLRPMCGLGSAIGPTDEIVAD